PDNIPEGAKKIGESVTEILEYKPGRLYVKKYIRPKYAPKDQDGIITGELPSLPIPKGNAGPGLLAHLFISKFVDHLPFYRQIQQYKREGIKIADSTINGWFTLSSQLLEPLYQVLVKRVQESSYIQADETPIKVLSSAKKGSSHKGYHWVYHSPLWNLVAFDYQEGRSREGPKKFLKNFIGTLQTDGYSAYSFYESDPDIKLIACMAHARRKFDDALLNNRELSEQAMVLIQKLYEIERKAKNESLNHNEIFDLRQNESIPILSEFEKFLKEYQTKVLPKSSLGIAINYTLNLWAKLKRYTTDGRLQIDNNLVENLI
ncbi:MAG: IS66 family transposase, partial [Desulfobacteraceae bacterium]|nr:IS66 family transposase [Desulfobacteraceae bacterium]